MLNLKYNYISILKKSAQIWEMGLKSSIQITNFLTLRAYPHDTTPRGDGPHGPSLGLPSKHTVPLGMDLARPVFLKSMPLFLRVSTPTGGSSNSKHTVPLGDWRE